MNVRRDVDDSSGASDPQESAPTIAITKAPDVSERNEIQKDHNIRRRRVGLVLAGTAALVGVVVASVIVFGRSSKSKSTLDEIKSRGRLRCGVQSNVDENTIEQGASLVGFNVDLCKALAAAVLESSSDKFTLIPVTPADRFVALNNHTVDVLISSTTHTMERQVYEPTTRKGYAFTIPYLYSGLMFGGIPPYGQCADTIAMGNVSTADVNACSGMTVCVVEGTTFAQDIPSVLDGSDYTLKVVPDMEAYYDHLVRGVCNVLAGDEFHTAPSVVQASGYSGRYEVGANFFSQEPHAIVTRQDDATWSDFVNWIVQSLIGAEELGITQARAASMIEPDVFGEQYKYMFVDAIEELGNYGELYARRLEGIVARKAANYINEGTSGTGLLYAMPFGKAESEGPVPVPGSTLHTIQERGFLKCGISEGLFSIYNTTTGEWTGFDVDFCRALSAAIFGGITDTVVFSDLSSVERFIALDKGEVDVLSRITTVTLIRDVLEPLSQAGFTFTQPNFYDGLLFGGIPPFGQCASDLEIGETTRRQECASLKICVTEGTTTIDFLKGLFPSEFIVPRQSDNLTIVGLQQSACNVISGGVGEVLESNVRRLGQYEGPYEIGSRMFSKDPLALVTRQNDHQWSAFVYWIVSAIYYAEDHNITSASSNKMPTVNLFGSDYSLMMQEAVNAVGSYQEIYDRNLSPVLPRGGLNLLNSNPNGPQHYSMPGLEE